MTTKDCSVDGCARPYFAKDLCQMHYARVLRGKPVGPAHPIERHGITPDRKEYTGEEASCPECATTFRRRRAGEPKKFCSTRCRARANDRQAKARGYQRPALPPCSVDGCEKPQQALGWCAMHRERVRKYGEPGSAESKHRPGEWRVSGDGYVIRWLDGETQLQHRVVMEQHLGRKLQRDETPHHKNGDRSDNSIGNLELWSSFQPPGQRVVDKLAYAREIIERYGDVPDEVLT